MSSVMATIMATIWASDGLPWLQDVSKEFYLVQGLVALSATLMLLWHMNVAWDTIRDLDQQLRYITLLAFAVVLTAGSAEQVNQNVGVYWRNLGSIAVAVLLIVTMVVSVRAVRRRRDV